MIIMSDSLNFMHVWPSREEYLAILYDGTYDSFKAIVTTLRKFYFDHDYFHKISFKTDPVSELYKSTLLAPDGSLVPASIDMLYSEESPDYTKLYKAFSGGIPVIANSMHSRVELYDYVLIKEDKLIAIPDEVYRFIFGENR